MFLLKNALKFVTRTKGRRNVTILVLSLIVLVLSCVALSILVSSWKTKKQLFENELTAVIVRVQQQNPGQGGNSNQVTGVEANLDYAQITYYGSSQYLRSYYYYMTSNVGASIAPYGAGGGGMGFRAIGFSSSEAMKDFSNGNCGIILGSMFDFSEDFKCMISAEVAYENKVNVGDKIKIYNPANRNESYELTVCGVFIINSSATNFQTPINNNSILMSYDTLSGMVKRSYIKNAIVEQRGNDQVLSGTTTTRFILKNKNSADAFLKDLRKMGLNELYSIQTNISRIEDSLLPLAWVEWRAGWFLLIVMGAGSLIMALINFADARKRRHEWISMSAMGMRKKKIALQIVAEVLVITLVSFLVGTIIASFISDPIADRLLENEVSVWERYDQQRARSQQRGQGRQGGQAGRQGGQGGQGGWQGGGFVNPIAINQVNYVRDINAGPNLLMVLGMLVLLFLMNLVASSASMVYIYKFSPMKIMFEQS